MASPNANHDTTSGDSSSENCLRGQCHCGAISYTAPLPPSIEETTAPGYDSTVYCNFVVPPSEQKYPNRGSRPNSNKWNANYCHCQACRRTIGALCATWLNVPKRHVSIRRDGPTGRYRASNRAIREFCQTCGTSMFFDEDECPDELSIALATLTFTTPNTNPFDYVEFRMHIWLEDAQDLILDADGKGGGLSGIINDGLPRHTQGTKSKVLW